MLPVLITVLYLFVFEAAIVFHAAEVDYRDKLLNVMRQDAINATAVYLNAYEAQHDHYPLLLSDISIDYPEFDSILSLPVKIRYRRVSLNDMIGYQYQRAYAYSPDYTKGYESTDMEINQCDSGDYKDVNFCFNTVAGIGTLLENKTRLFSSLVAEDTRMTWVTHKIADYYSQNGQFPVDLSQIPGSLAGITPSWPSRFIENYTRITDDEFQYQVQTNILYNGTPIVLTKQIKVDP